jgi:hypothetical protein
MGLADASVAYSKLRQLSRYTALPQPWPARSPSHAACRTCQGSPRANQESRACAVVDRFGAVQALCCRRTPNTAKSASIYDLHWMDMRESQPTSTAAGTGKDWVCMAARQVHTCRESADHEVPPASMADSMMLSRSRPTRLEVKPADLMALPPKASQRRTTGALPDRCPSMVRRHGRLPWRVCGRRSPTARQSKRPP